MDTRVDRKGVPIDDGSPRRPTSAIQRGTTLYITPAPHEKLSDMTASSGRRALQAQQHRRPGPPTYIQIQAAPGNPGSDPALLDVITMILTTFVSYSQIPCNNHHAVANSTIFKFHYPLPIDLHFIV